MNSPSSPQSFYDSTFLKDTLKTLIIFSVVLLYSLSGLGFFHLIDPASGQVAKNSLVVLGISKYVDGTNNLNIEGEVQNNSSSTAAFVQVIGTFYDSVGNVVGTDFSVTNPSTLIAGERAPFHIILSEASIPVVQIAKYSLQVKALLT